MQLDQETKNRLDLLLESPERAGAGDIGLLNRLTGLFPYYQPLYLLLAKASAHADDKAEKMAAAAVYTCGSLLYDVIHHPEQLIKPITAAKPLAKTYLTIHVDAKELAVPEVAAQGGDPASENGLKQEIASIDKAKTDNLTAESMATTDFFAFENLSVDSEKEPPTVVFPEEYNQTAEEESVLSKYNDDKLPYTFLWWLAKTRKEHAESFRPYATVKQQPNAPVSVVNPLQHQYVEHIFHLQTPFSGEESREEDLNQQQLTKNGQIIDSFIKNEPQIKPPKANQIDNENKAKKSAEDHYDLVSETLASIYIEQTLYHKAIDTYQKLSLKFPEKSRYFADLIQSLEKKI